MSSLQQGPMYTRALPLVERHAVHFRPLRMPATMRRVLYRAIHHEPDSGHAQWQAGRCALRSIGRRSALPHLRATRAADLLRRAATVARDVWR